ncbi:MAG: DUF2118 domain-containing protein [Armatimonadetes bacterium]|nr:DUF2118 domain-containing protein [Armatimonadota bacterium]
MMRIPAGLWLLVAIAVGMLGGAAAAAPKQVVDVKATLRGEVVPEGLSKVGDDVSEGDPLVYVKTQTGRAAAARATVDGRVVEVLVRPGSMIRELGAVVARIEPK